MIEVINSCRLFDIEKQEFESEENLKNMLLEAMRLDDHDTVIELCGLIAKNDKIKNKKVWE